MTLAKILAASCLALAALASPARADMVLSQVIVDLLPGKAARDDIEVFNNGEDRIYVAAEVFEIRGAGTPAEERVPIAPDPEQSGLLVSPQKLVLGPGERRTVRVAAIGDRPAVERVYRIAIRPVAGPLAAEQSALKLFVGYDALVLVRPAQVTGDLAGERRGRSLVITNASNVAQELFGGQQCDAAGRDCRALPAKRLYAGASWRQTLPYDTEARYKSAIGPAIRERRF
jgi:P pilus assembly chaperone PapD